MHPRGATNPEMAKAPGRPPPPPAASWHAAEAQLEEIRRLLGDCRYREAQSLARTAAVRYPGHPEVGDMNRALNEWTATTHPATGVDRSQETEWMRRDMPDSLRGQVVALVGAEVVATADTMTELGRQLRSMALAKRPLVFRVA